LKWVTVSNKTLTRCQHFPRSFRPSNLTGRIDQEGGADRPVNGSDRPGADRPQQLMDV